MVPSGVVASSSSLGRSSTRGVGGAEPDRAGDPVGHLVEVVVEDVQLAEHGLADGAFVREPLMRSRTS